MQHENTLLQLSSLFDDNCTSMPVYITLLWLYNLQMDMAMACQQQQQYTIQAAGTQSYQSPMMAGVPQTLQVIQALVLIRWFNSSASSSNICSKLTKCKVRFPNQIQFYRFDFQNSSDKNTHYTSVVLI